MNITDKTKLKVLTNQQTLLSIRFCPKDSEDGPAKVFHGLYKKKETLWMIRLTKSNTYMYIYLNQEKYRK